MFCAHRCLKLSYRLNWPKFGKKRKRFHKITIFDSDGQNPGICQNERNCWRKKAKVADCIGDVPWIQGKIERKTLDSRVAQRNNSRKSYSYGKPTRI